MATGWVVEPLTSLVEIDEVLAVEQASFTNPWTREMYLTELGHEGISFVYLARDAERRMIGFRHGSVRPSSQLHPAATADDEQHGQRCQDHDGECDQKCGQAGPRIER